MRLENKVAVVTGAARGIGRAIAIAMAREGALVVLSDRDQAVLAETLAEIGGKALGIVADISEPASIEALFAQVDRDCGRVDILVNNAGMGIPRLFVEVPLDEWERHLKVNLTGTFLCSQAAVRRMMAQGGGRIVNIASLSGQKGGIHRSSYGASKAGVELLTKVMAVELAEHGIGTNAIAPGPVNTDVAKVMHTEETRLAYHRLIPQRRYGSPEEIADAAVFLASDEARYINGHTLNVDGGFLAAGLCFPYPPTEART
jgi:NAD(P)-dependent dehydrogenase (short-subunit alcohol dehydrogenase family)